jgi:transposase-like protein
MPSKRVGKYSEAIKEQAAIQYAIDGCLSKVARDIDVPRTTVNDWSKEEWWDGIIDKVRHEKQQEHIATYTKIVDEAQKVVLEKLPEASASQASLIACQAQDKSLLLQGKATSISRNTNSMEDLSAQFRALAASHQLVPRSKVIDIKPTRSPVSDDKD